MEGIGSRLGRGSARYGPAPVFTGPVRKWKKQWVHVSQSSSSTLSYQSNTSQFNNGNGNNNNNNPPSLILCRWTPITPTRSGDSDNSSICPEEPPRRKFRYSPMVVLEEKKKDVARKVDDESRASKTNQSTARESTENEDIFEKTSIENVLMEETQASKASNKCQLTPVRPNESHMDLDLCSKGYDDDQDSDGENEAAKLDRGGADVFSALA